MADSFGDHDTPQEGAGKRPAQTIEGTATEVAVHVPEEAEAKPVPSERKGPPPASTISEMKSFVTHLAAGLLGGLIGVIGLAFAWHLLPAGNGASGALAGLEQRLAKLESAPPPSPAPDTEALAQLDARIKALESRPVETPPDISGLTDRVAQLEQAMKALA